MKLQALVVTLVAVLPALAAPNCTPPQVVQGNNCTLSVSLGWVIAGLGTDSVYTLYVPPNTSGPVSFQVTALNSNLGSNYQGYLGIKVSSIDGSQSEGPYTISDILAGGPDVISPGEQSQTLVTQVCWDPTCTSPAPAGAVPNMFSVQVLISSPVSADIGPSEVQLTVRFLTEGRVTFQTQETGVRSNSLYSIIPGINLGATPEGRYVFTGSAVNLPYDVLSITNLNNPNPVTGTATLKDHNGNPVAMASIPAIPPGGAAGYLVIGRNPDDPLALFPSSLVLPAGADGVFHGILEIGTSGQTATGQLVVLGQEFNGNSMLNLFVFHSSIP